jgi:hypothetical protein
MSAIFATESTENPLTLVRQTLAVKPNDDGEIMVTFTTNRGKGSGSQVMPYQEFRAAVQVLMEAATQGIPENTQDENLPASEVIKRTIAVEDGIVSFRTKNGKGAKPARFSVDDFAAVADLLASTVDAVESAGKALTGAKKK